VHNIIMTALTVPTWYTAVTVYNFDAVWITVYRYAVCLRIPTYRCGYVICIIYNIHGGGNCIIIIFVMRIRCPPTLSFSFSRALAPSLTRARSHDDTKPVLRPPRRGCPGFFRSYFIYSYYYYYYLPTLSRNRLKKKKNLSLFGNFYARVPIREYPSGPMRSLCATEPEPSAVISIGVSPLHRFTKQNYHSVDVS